MGTEIRRLKTAQQGSSRVRGAGAGAKMRKKIWETNGTVNLYRKENMHKAIFGMPRSM
jgi:hypothetical protein